MSKPKPVFPDETLIEICSLWFRENLGPTKIKDIINKKQGHKINREQVYTLLKEACDRGFIRISPPEHNELSWKLMTKYGGSIKVVSTGDFFISDSLASKAAELIIDRIRDLGTEINPEGNEREKVHLGMGAGITTRSVASEIANLYNADSSLPDLEIHALTSGFQSDRAHLSPISWFSWFMNSARERVSFVGLFAPPMVHNVDIYNEIKTLPGITEAYDKAKEIQIVVTSLGNAMDSAERWIPFVPDDQKEGLRKKYGWKGDVLYCPFSDTGPIPENRLELQAVTIFNINDLVEMAKSRKHMIVLICGPSHTKERRRKTQALKPLLENEELRVWTHLITDVRTAREILYGEE